MKKIGWIGVGKMGSRMAKRLMGAGYPLYVCDTYQPNAEAMKEQGAVVAANPAELAATCDVVFSMIPNGKALKEIVNGENGFVNGASQGTIIVDMSTIDPATSAEVAEALARTGVEFLRATVTGSIAFAEEGTLGIMASGPRKVYDEVLPLLRHIGNRQRYLGDAEQSRYMKIAINMMLGVAMQMLAEALCLGEKANIDWNLLIECICDSAAATPMFKAKEQALKARDFTAMATSTMMRKDMQLAMDLAKDLNVTLPVTAISTHYYNAMEAQGFGELDYSGLILVNEALCNLGR
jgi:3-hydroxyisobutyrate dehydrogenase-like beta-hydroxyacid dehydrogenase